MKSSYHEHATSEDSEVGLHDADVLMQVFADLPHVMFCLKNADGHYEAANDAFVRRTGKRSVRHVVGQRAGDLFPSLLAASYEAQDRAVFTSGQPVRFQLEIITDAEGSEAWYLTNKMLISGPSGESLLAVISVEAQLPKRSSPAGSGLRMSIDHARLHFTEPVRVEELARIATMSLAQFERAIGKALGVTPKQFLQRLRSDHAATLLATTDASIAEVASACGYYDQSQFTRLFRSATGLTPGRYRASASASARN